jgi:hypothetical protein
MQNHMITLYLPLVLTNILHMFVVKYNLLSFLRYPLSPSIFGKNKTYRGFVFVTFANGIFLLICTRIFNIEIHINPFVLGLILGLSYLFFELPNSFLKRRLGIAPGEKSKKFKVFFIFLDRCDSAFGVSLIYVLLLGLGFKEFSYLFLFAFGVHFFFSFLLYRIGVKESL